MHLKEKFFQFVRDEMNMYGYAAHIYVINNKTNRDILERLGLNIAARLGDTLGVYPSTNRNVYSLHAASYVTNYSDISKFGHIIYLGGE